VDRRVGEDVAKWGRAPLTGAAVEGEMKVEMVADLCEAIAEYIAAQPQAAELTARKLSVVLRKQAHREEAEKLSADERERTTGSRY
jgi:hypothetical protein